MNYWIFVLFTLLSFAVIFTFAAITIYAVNLTNKLIWKGIKRNERK